MALSTGSRHSLCARPVVGTCCEVSGRGPRALHAVAAPM